ncbi:hypothetical protein BJ508DRAFT_341703 [Ascobolus immersus RN42]|uniref:Uncharacterized protein n=1 Tax=Ascobolus immersus RN42 TaxID=1160509 RepID=A0A3N4HGF7_ASCIM|nr:hypothetical protein BJ508DRAFT_341703 [Ascobolus immersus RN42]
MFAGNRQRREARPAIMDSQDPANLHAQYSPAPLLDEYHCQSDSSYENGTDQSHTPRDVEAASLKMPGNTTRKKKSIGFKTPLLIIFCWIGGVVTAIGNYMLFHHLHLRRTSETIPQRWLFIVATGFTIVARSLLGTALAVAYVQHLWRKFRTTWMEANLIEQLLSLPTSSLDFFLVRKFNRACIPTGSLRIVNREVSQKEPVTAVVPRMNLTYRRNEFWAATEMNALFRGNADMAFEWVKLNVQESVTNVLRSGKLSLWEDLFPGQNSSYEVQFPGPSIICKTVPVGNITNLWFSQYSMPSLTDGKTYEHFQKETGGQSVEGFQVWYRPEILIHSYRNSEGSNKTESDFVSTQCIAGTTNYTVQVYHSVGRDKSRISFTRQDELFSPITDTYFGSSWSGLYFYFQARRFTDMADVWLNTTDGPFPPAAWDLFEQHSDEIPSTLPFWKRYFEMQSLTIFQAFHNSLAGSITAYGSRSSEEVEGGVLGTSLVTLHNGYSKGYLRLNLTPEALQEAFANVTVSLAGSGFEGWNTTVNVTINEWTNVYEFDRQLLILSYAPVSVVSLLLCLVGMYGLFKNGVSAKGGSFLQIIATTSAAKFSTLRKRAIDCCEGGEDNFTEEFQNLTLRFGELVQPEKTELVRKEYPDGLDQAEVAAFGTGTYGFGTHNEVITIRKK